jgi:catechol 2,3-dioxygenase-like lactoylglutathione lyase family enzyme
MLENPRLQSIILTARIEAARAFYEDVLGLQLTAQSDGALVFNVGGCDLRVSPVPEVVPSEHTVIGFAVDDLEAAVHALTRSGVALERFDEMPHDAVGVVVSPDGARVAWARDPDGNIISIVEFPHPDYRLTTTETSDKQL